MYLDVQLIVSCDKLTWWAISYCFFFHGQACFVNDFYQGLIDDFNKILD